MTNSGHILQAFDQSLQTLAATIQAMGRTVMKELDDALVALLEQASERVTRAVAEDIQTDRMQQQINDQVMHMAARHQPLADDLRCILAATRIAGNLERAGDHAKNIAKRSLALNQRLSETDRILLRRLANSVRKMLQEALTAHANGDASAATHLWQIDHDVDRIYQVFCQHLLSQMQQQRMSIVAGTHLLLAAKSLERIGDHATNLAEEVTFMVTGTLTTRPHSDDSPLNPDDGPMTP